MVIEEIEMGRATRKLICETLGMDPKTLRRRLRGEETVKRRQRPCPSQELIRERLKVLAETSFDPEGLRTEGHPHWGVRRLWALLRREGIKVSRKKRFTRPCAVWVTPCQWPEKEPSGEWGRSRRRPPALIRCGR